LGNELLVAHPALLMPNLTKRDLVVKISNETGLVQHQVFEVIQKTLDQITTALSKGQDVELRNFGVFQVRLSKARVGRNPNIPGSNFAIPPRATVKFKSGKIMRRDVLALSDNMKKGPAKAPARVAVRSGATVSKRANGQN
jgi:nucleoid DNA-binding protein